MTDVNAIARRYIELFVIEPIYYWVVVPKALLKRFWN